MRKIACFTPALLHGVLSTDAAEATLLTNAAVVDVTSGSPAAEAGE